MLKQLSLLNCDLLSTTAIDVMSSCVFFLHYLSAQLSIRLLLSSVRLLLSSIRLPLRRQRIWIPASVGTT